MKMNKILLLAFSLCLVAGGLFAQRSGTLNKAVPPTLTIQANVALSELLIDGASQKFTLPYKVQVAAGAHTIVGRAPGYLDATQAIDVAADMTISLVLTPQVFNLSVNANVPGAQVSLSNGQGGAAGSVFNLPGGTYQVKVSAPGYLDFVTSVPLNGNQTVSANLVPITYSLSVSSNVKGAQVFVNNNAVGNDSVTATFTPGTYSVTVRAPGYVDFTASVQLNGNQTVKAVLQPMTGTLKVEAPDGAGLMVFVDGSLVKFGKIGKGEKGVTSSLVLPVGAHTVRYEMGFVVAETQVTVNLGQTVTVSPSFTILVK